MFKSKSLSRITRLVFNKSSKKGSDSQLCGKIRTDRRGTALCENCINSRYPLIQDRSVRKVQSEQNIIYRTSQNNINGGSNFLKKICKSFDKVKLQSSCTQLIEGKLLSKKLKKPANSVSLETQNLFNRNEKVANNLVYDRKSCILNNIRSETKSKQSVTLSTKEDADENTKHNFKKVSGADSKTTVFGAVNKIYLFTRKLMRLSSNSIGKQQNASKDCVSETKVDLIGLKELDANDNKQDLNEERRCELQEPINAHSKSWKHDAIRNIENVIQSVSDSSQLFTLQRNVLKTHDLLPLQHNGRCFSTTSLCCKSIYSNSLLHNKKCIAKDTNDYNTSGYKSLDKSLDKKTTPLRETENKYFSIYKQNNEHTSLKRANDTLELAKECDSHVLQTIYTCKRYKQEETQMKLSKKKIQKHKSEQLKNTSTDMKNETFTHNNNVNFKNLQRMENITSSKSANIENSRMKSFFNTSDGTNVKYDDLLIPHSYDTPVTMRQKQLIHSAAYKAIDIVTPKAWEREKGYKPDKNLVYQFSELDTVINNGIHISSDDTTIEKCEVLHQDTLNVDKTQTDNLHKGAVAWDRNNPYKGEEGSKIDNVPNAVAWECNATYNTDNGNKIVSTRNAVPWDCNKTYAINKQATFNISGEKCLRKRKNVWKPNIDYDSKTEYNTLPWVHCSKKKENDLTLRNIKEQPTVQTEVETRASPCKTDVKTELHTEQVNKVTPTNTSQILNNKHTDAILPLINNKSNEEKMKNIKFNKQTNVLHNAVPNKEMFDKFPLAKNLNERWTQKVKKENNSTSWFTENPIDTEQMTIIRSNSLVEELNKVGDEQLLNDVHQVDLKICASKHSTLTNKQFMCKTKGSEQTNSENTMSKDVASPLNQNQELVNMDEPKGHSIQITAQTDVYSNSEENKGHVDTILKKVISQLNKNYSPNVSNIELLTRKYNEKPLDIGTDENSTKDVKPPMKNLDNKITKGRSETIQRTPPLDILETKIIISAKRNQNPTVSKTNITNYFHERISHMKRTDSKIRDFLENNFLFKENTKKVNKNDSNEASSMLTTKEETPNLMSSNQNVTKEVSNNILPTPINSESTKGNQEYEKISISPNLMSSNQNVTKDVSNNILPTPINSESTKGNQEYEKKSGSSITNKQGSEPNANFSQSPNLIYQSDVSPHSNLVNQPVKEDEIDFSLTEKAHNERIAELYEYEEKVLGIHPPDSNPFRSKEPKEALKNFVEAAERNEDIKESSTLKNNILPTSLNSNSSKNENITGDSWGVIYPNKTLRIVNDSKINEQNKPFSKAVRTLQSNTEPDKNTEEKSRINKTLQNKNLSSAEVNDIKVFKAKSIVEEKENVHTMKSGKKPKNRLVEETISELKNNTLKYIKNECIVNKGDRLFLNKELHTELKNPKKTEYLGVSDKSGEKMQYYNVPKYDKVKQKKPVEEVNVKDFMKIIQKEMDSKKLVHAENSFAVKEEIQKYLPYKMSETMLQSMFNAIFTEGKKPEKKISSNTSEDDSVLAQLAPSEYEVDEASDNESESKPIMKLSENKFPMINVKKSGLVYPMTEDVITADYNDAIRYKHIPSVSKILNDTIPNKMKQALNNWETKKINRFGKSELYKFYQHQIRNDVQFHDCVRRHLMGTPIKVLTENATKETRGCMKSLRKVFSKLKQVTVLESPVVHSHLPYHGIVDCIACYRGNPVLIEWKQAASPKTTDQLTIDAPIQLAAYIGAINHDMQYQIPVTSGIIVMGYMDGSQAGIFHLSNKQCEMYWEMWLKRLEKYVIAKYQ